MYSEQRPIGSFCSVIGEPETEPQEEPTDLNSGSEPSSPEVYPSSPQDVPLLDLESFLGDDRDSETIEDSKDDPIPASDEDTPRRQPWQSRPGPGPASSLPNVLSNSSNPTAVSPISVTSEVSRRPWRRSPTRTPTRTEDRDCIEEPRARRPWRKSAEEEALERKAAEDAARVEAGQRMTAARRGLNCSETSFERSAPRTPRSTAISRARLDDSPVELNSATLTREHAEELLYDLLQERQHMNQEIADMRWHSQQVSNDMRAVLHEETRHARQEHKETMKKLLSEIQEAHQVARKAQEEAYQFELDAMVKKLEASNEMNTTMEKQVALLRTELGASDEKRRNYESSMSELDTLRDEVGSLRLTNDQLQFEIEHHQNESETAQDQANQLELQLSKYEEHARVISLDLKKSEGDKKKQAAEIENIRRVWKHETARQQTEIEATKRALASTNARAAASAEQVRQMSLQLKTSEEQRRSLEAQVETMQCALDANARAEASLKQARIDDGKEAEERRRMQQAEMEERMRIKEETFNTEMKAAEARWRETQRQMQAELDEKELKHGKQQQEIKAQQSMIKRWSARVHRYAEYALFWRREVENMSGSPEEFFFTEYD